jgi:hypothetical protein
MRPPALAVRGQTRGESRDRSAALTVAAGLNGPIIKLKVADLCHSVIAWIHALGTLCRTAPSPRLFAALLNLIRPSPTNLSLGDCRAQFKNAAGHVFRAGGVVCGEITNPQVNTEGPLRGNSPVGRDSVCARK